MEREYKEGLYMDDFVHIRKISCYNNNYYVGFGRDLLFGKSNDDTLTEWWLINGETSTYLGESHDNDGLLHRYEKRNT